MQNLLNQINANMKGIFGVANTLDSLIALQRLRRSGRRNLHNLIWERAYLQSAEFIEANLSEAVLFEFREQIWDYVISKLQDDCEDNYCLEFGVAGGDSINWFSERLKNMKFYGFDSFHGLDEDWHGHHAIVGEYTQGGVLPKVNNNVSLVEGWFRDTVPGFCKNNPEVISKTKLFHIDSDTYGSTKTVFDSIGHALKPGVFVLFDELTCYPNWKNGEYKALEEAQIKFNFQYQFKAFASERALIQIV
jgi:hypothetical protein